MSAWIFAYVCSSLSTLPVAVTYVHSLRDRLQPLHVCDNSEDVARVLYLQEPKTKQEGERGRLEKERDKNVGVE